MALPPRLYLSWFLRRESKGLFDSSPQVEDTGEKADSPVPKAVVDQKLLKSSVSVLNAELKRAFAKQFAADGLFSHCPRQSEPELSHEQEGHVVNEKMRSSNCL